ncbi:HAD-IIA family hydrolase [Halorussus sp. MSC15.2]|uniref:HAD-IIA family hydrolase n=1 Tax=Halorussus sp. MSC15.2 TaxID=2283638 RepID=UPI0013D51BA5|nr:HAD-IIA family hydrolase [Halorussus sp. MSC15.2]NEU56303.1 HAD-IIA family hydrolase [Halorussus sp. MSC15.2]
MKGVILAAGIGSRLRPLTLEKPKSCVTVDGTPILAHQLRAYADAGVTDVVVVAGYLADDVRALCEEVADSRPDLDVTVRESEVFANTDNMYSLYLAREAVAGEPFVLTNGDVVFEPELLADLLAADADSAIATDTATFSEEAMKVTVGDRGRATHIAKSVPADVAHGVSTDAYRFSAAFSEALFDEITRTIEREGDYGDWTEAAVDRLLRGGTHDVEPVDVSQHRWVEIDDFDDLRTADRRFSSLSDLGEKEAVFFDLDGTMYLDDDLVTGADGVVEALRNRGVEVYFLTNNSSKWKDDYAERLTDLGVSAAEEDVLLSTDGVLQHLRRTDPDGTFVLGTTEMRDALADRGVEVVDEPDSGEDAPDAVVVGFDTELTYEKARKATLAVRDGATFLLAHADAVCPTAEGFVPDCGAIGAMIERATDRSPDRVFGKPNVEMVAPVLDAEGYAPEDVAVVGDRLATDVRLAENVGCESVCVLTGDATRAEVESSDRSPTLVAPTVAALTEFVRGDATPDETTPDEATTDGGRTDGATAEERTADDGTTDTKNSAASADGGSER